MIRTKAVAVIATAATVALLLPSCTRLVTDAHAVAGEEAIADISSAENPCTPVDAPLAVVPTDAGDPVLKIPQPSGRERFTEMDSEMVRFAMRNQTLGTIAVITAESAGGVGDPEEAFQGVHEGISELLGAGAATDITRLEHCGLPAETMSYINPGFGQSGRMPTKALTVVMVNDGSTHVISVQVAKKRPQDPDASRDVDTIITGFQVLPPSAS
jgi:hypothetical protein